MIGEDRIRPLEEELRQAKERERDLRDLLSVAIRRIDELERSVAEGLSNGAASPSSDNGGEGVDYAPPRIMGDGPGFFVSPDEVATDQGTPKRKSVSLMPETDGGVQLHEFDNAPSVGRLSIKRAGKKLLLTDPDGTSGQRKWMVPLRRETSGSIELKWAKLGEGSDSDSDADFPCQDEYTLEGDGSDGDCGTTISLKRQAYKRGTGGQCEPDGNPEGAGSVTIPNPPEYSMSGSDGDGCTRTITLWRTPCGENPASAGSVEIDKPKSYTLRATSAAGACTKTYRLKEIDCAGGEGSVGDEIEVPTPPAYSISETQDSTACLRKYQITKTECGGSPATVSGSSTIEVPGKDSISATATGSTAGGTKAGTVTVTPCGGTATNIDIYNGRDGSDGDDGCTPIVSVSSYNPSPPTSPSQATLAGKIEITPCGGTKQTINVYNGKDASGVTGVNFDTNLFAYRTNDHWVERRSIGVVWTNGILTSRDATWSNWSQFFKLLNGTFVTEITGLSIVNNALRLSYKKVTYTDGVPGTEQSAYQDISGTTCS